MKTMSKSAKKFFAAAACMGMLLVCFAGCNQLNGGGATEQQNPNNPSNSQKSSKKQLLEFKLEKANNADVGLSKDVKGRVNEKNYSVTIEVPAGTDKTKLKASFKISDKAKLFIGTVEQKSGETVNDFSNITDGVKLTVKAEDGTTQEYTVKVYVEIRIRTFGFKQMDNTQLPGDVTAAYCGFLGGRGVIIIKLPVGTTEESLKTLKPSFGTSPDVELFVKDTKLENGMTPVDFSEIVDGTTTEKSWGATIVAKASDGGTLTYTAVVEVDLEQAPKTEVEKYFGSYKGVIPGLGEVMIVLAWDKITLYSSQMSMYYQNMEWEKMADGKYTCTAYTKNKPKVKGMFGKSNYTFIEETGGVIKVTGAIMGRPVTATKQTTDFVWTPECGYKKANPM
ncbi:cadherin-like beta sandwich domain-containing protein [Treponema sp. OMZ 906]|jgi:hypothetical protein ELI_4191|uniref:cadherin-like beta sandwich domain-containing protein n=1 Tax=Treponema sp. OMZ 906 TaxID=2563662 RepID=UPI0020A4BA34|nr:cadherin-like beta sandwich domain-containing protein [Treponema sp. OMZ 906]UTC55468.1 hypothetical protein E4N69_12185 [Treponema sp. OMZ 906]